MKVNVNWLRELVDPCPPLEELPGRLTMIGLEVEGLEVVAGEPVLDVSVTANRPDCLSMIGIARDLAAASGARLIVPGAVLAECGAPIESITSVELLAPALCPRYTARVIEGVRVGPSPAWLVQRLETAGLRSVNNVVDVTNFVLLETGHPLHAFDLDRLEGRRIVVREAAAGETIVTIDGQERALAPGMCVIADARRPVALAGVMGGRETEVQEDTRRILLESAYFEPTSIRRTSKAVRLASESSLRFERGADPAMAPPAADRAAGLIAELAGGEVRPGRIDARDPARGDFAGPIVDLRFDRITRLLGDPVPPETVAEILGRLGLVVQARTAAGLRLAVPSFRPDLTREADLIEEVARLHGFEHFRATLPAQRLDPPAGDDPAETIEEMRRFLLAGGLSEAVSFSFEGPRLHDRIGLPGGHLWRTGAALLNPMSEDQSLMRRSLIPGLLAAYERNRRRGADGLALFEIGRVFEARPLPEPPVEIRTLAGLSAPPRRAVWQQASPPAGFYGLAGLVRTLLGRHFGAVELVEGPVPFGRPGRSAQVVLAGRPVGFVAELPATSAAALEAPRELTVFELDLDQVLAAGRRFPVFEPLPRFPAVVHDMALLTDRRVAYGRVLEVIRETGSDLLEQVCLFDIYEGKGIPDGKVSLAVSLTYRHPDRTLTEEEAEARTLQIAEELAGRLGIERR